MGKLPGMQEGLSLFGLPAGQEECPLIGRPDSHPHPVIAILIELPKTHRALPGWTPAEWLHN